MELSKQYTRKAKKTESSIQATIPADIAEYLNIGEGDIVLYKVNSNVEQIRSTNRVATLIDE